MHTIAAKRPFVLEAFCSRLLKKKYTLNGVVKNAIAEALQKKAGLSAGYRRYQQSYEMLINIYGSFGIDGHEAETAFDAIELTMNKNVIADDPLPAFSAQRDSPRHRR